jgi:hypothetical protein
MANPLFVNDLALRIESVLDGLLATDNAAYVTPVRC